MTYRVPRVISAPPCSSFPGKRTACPAFGASSARPSVGNEVPPPSYSRGSFSAMVKERSDWSE
eukprot:6204100-Pleurochrysis_carterae.AAC.5